MRYEFKLPDIGEGVTEGEVVSWLVGVGDAVAEDQDMVEVMTDKATVTIGAPKSGKVVEIRGSEGEVIPVGGVLVVLEVSGDGEARRPRPPEAQAAEKEPAPEKPPPPAVEAPAPAAAPAPPAAAKGNGAETGATAVGDLKDELPGMAVKGVEAAGYFNDKPLAAPATRKLARELGLDLRRVPPGGPGGRVTREDVERFARGVAGPAQRAQAPAPAAEELYEAVTTRPVGAPPAPGVEARIPRPLPVSITEADERVPIRGLRKRIFENMARAKRTAAHFTYVDECDVTKLQELRSRVQSQAESAGVRLTFLPFIIKAVVAALRRHPALNCVVDDAAQEMVLRKGYDIGIAVATEAGLTVPVLRAADRRTMLEIAQELQRLATEARAGKTRREDLGGSSFTITSLGREGGLFATPVVNYPEVAILGVHAIKRRPVVRGDEIAVGDVMLLSLSFDHRIIDGHVGAAFAQEVIRYLEEPDRLMLELR